MLAAGRVEHDSIDVLLALGMVQPDFGDAFVDWLAGSFVVAGEHDTIQIQLVQVGEFDAFIVAAVLVGIVFRRVDDAFAALVDNDELLWVERGDGLTPGGARLLVALAGCQCLFLCVQPSRRMARHIVASLRCCP